MKSRTQVESDAFVDFWNSLMRTIKAALDAGVSRGQVSSILEEFSCFLADEEQAKERFVRWSSLTLGRSTQLGRSTGGSNAAVRKKRDAEERRRKIAHADKALLKANPRLSKKRRSELLHERLGYGAEAIRKKLA